ncbi:hypothetical protein PMIN04_011442 [Paraphaeosphaeria minitans]|uniref:DUF6590 domain-containing protein n=1 Tax=Paraphaeosphaeria minitans TaxID=565426 RepID=A0A9P6GIW6_9PLEO|nr:hypothetical protein PMIN01_04341 [Paraphaeosphaeria minitans]
MSKSSSSAWTWDANRKDHYYVTKDASGNYVYHFQKEQTPVAADPRSTYPTGVVDLGASHCRNDSLAASADPVLAGTIQGTEGWSERLDPSYRMWTGSEAYKFFRIGKVFSMLHVQAASESELKQVNDNISVIKYGERAFSQIRRFVIVEVRRGFVYACPISTYSKRGTTKGGCIPSEHSVVYMAGTNPSVFQGEMLVKQAIRVTPAPSDPHVRMHAASRLHYAKAYLIEMNVKVKDIGDVDPAHLSLLLQYYRYENGIDQSSTYTYSQPQGSSQYGGQGYSQFLQGSSHGNPGYQPPYYGSH